MKTPNKEMGFRAAYLVVTTGWNATITINTFDSLRRAENFLLDTPPTSEGVLYCVHNGMKEVMRAKKVL